MKDTLFASPWPWGGVLLRPLVACLEITFPVNEIQKMCFFWKMHSIHDECHSCYPGDAHHGLEDDDQELGEGHQLFQLETCAARHTTSFTVLDVHGSLAPVVAWLVGGSLCRWNCCPWRCWIWRSCRSVGTNLYPASTASCFISCNFCQCFKIVGTWLNWSCSMSLAGQSHCPHVFVSRSFIPCGNVPFHRIRMQD